MSQSRQNMRSAFSEFEPEVSDAGIERSWERMKYFLPQKRKRRAFLFLDLSGFVKLAAMLAVVVLAFTIYHSEGTEKAYAMQEPGIATVKTPGAESREVNKQPDRPGKQVNHKTPSSPVNAPLASASAENSLPDPKNIPAPGEKNEVPAADNLPHEKKYTNPGAENGIAAVAKKLPEQENTEVPDAENTLTGVADKVNTPPVEDPQQDPGSSIAPADPQPGSTEGAVSDKLSERIAAENAAAKETELVSDRSSLRSLLLSSARPPDSLNPALDLSQATGKKEMLLRSVRKKFLVEAAAGPALSYSTIDPVEGISNERKTGLSASLGAAYYFKNRWSLTGNALYTENKWNYVEERSEGFIVMRRAPNWIGTWTGSLDTTRLIEVTNRITLSTRSDYLFGLGIANEVWRSKKLSIEPFVQVAMRYSEYDLTSATLQSSDTIVVIQASNAPSSYRVANPAPEYSEQYARYVFGIMPGLNVNYRITPKLSLVLKPQFSAQLSAEEIRSHALDFKLRQDRLSLLLGLRIRIGN